MSDVDRAAKVIADFNACGHCEGTCGACRGEAEALDAAGLLAKYPHLEVEGDWLIEVVNYHTCGAGPGSGAGHEPGCGTIPVGRLATPEHDAAVIEKFLRERDTPSVRIENPEAITPLLAKVWAEGYGEGVHDERMAADYNAGSPFAGVSPARINPYEREGGRDA